jgi:hypothetical protein
MLRWLLKEAAYRLLVFLSLALVSCDGFLEGSDIKNGLDSTLEYNKLPVVTVNISPQNSDHGVVADSGERKVHLGDEVTAEFTLKDGYTFKDWLIINRMSYEDMSDCVIEIEKDWKIRNSFFVYTFKFKVTKECSNLWITPECNDSEDTNPPEFYLDNGGVLVSESKEKYNAGVLLTYASKVPSRFGSSNENALTEKEYKYIRTSKFYVKLFALEAESSIDGVVVTEVLRINSNGDTRNVSQAYTLDSSSFNVNKVSNSLWNVDFEYTMHSALDGLFRIDICVIDSSNNISTQTQSFYIYNDKTVVIPEDFAFNAESAGRKRIFEAKETDNNAIEMLADKLFITEPQDAVEYWYKTPSSSADYELSDIQDNYIYSYSLVDGDGNETALTVTDCVADITGISRAKGLTVRCKVSDSVGNSVNRDVYIPYVPETDYVCLSGEENSQVYIYLKDNDPVFSDKIYEIMDENNLDRSEVRSFTSYVYKKKGDVNWTYLPFSTYIPFNEEDETYYVYIIESFYNYITDTGMIVAGTDEYYNTLCSDLIEINVSDFVNNPDGEYSFSSNYKPDFTYEFISDGVNSGTYTLNIDVTNFEEKGFDHYDIAIVTASDGSSDISGTRTRSWTRKASKSGISLKSITSDRYIYVKAYYINGNSRYYDYRTIKISAVPEENIAPGISVSFNNSNFQRNMFWYYVSDSSSIKDTKVYYTPEDKERTIDEIRALPDYFEGVYNSSNRYDFKTFTLESGKYAAYIYAEDLYGNYSVKKIKLNADRIEGFFNKTSSNRWAAVTDLTALPSAYFEYKKYYFSTSYWYAISTNTTVTGRSSLFNKISLWGVYDDSDNLMGTSTYPFYYYPGTSEPLIRIVETIDEQSVSIAHDSYVLVQTYWGTKNYGRDYNKWIVNTDPGHDKNECVYTAYSSETKIDTYTIDTESIESGNYYCAVIHFADGKTKVSEVQYKE